jgi:hypothetical protein
MAEVLSLYGFSVTKCLGPGDGVYGATRKGIMGAWKHLLSQTKHSDAVVIYYSGHGGITEADAPEAGQQKPRRLQYIIPLDFAETGKDDWRGISDAELAGLLQQTTEITPNVTTIFDCCHSARMARGRAWVKTIDPGAYPNVMAHIQKMLDEMPATTKEALDLQRNKNVLSVVAAGRSASAFEKLFAGDRERMGVLTEALAHTLRGCVGAEIPWSDILRRVRERVRRTCPEQDPNVEGPQDRVPFRLGTPKGGSGGEALSLVESAPGEFLLGGGRLHGVNRGDVLAVMPFEEGRLVESRMLAEAKVTVAGPTAARVQMEWRKGREQVLAPGAKAFVWKSSVLLPVGFLGEEEYRCELREELQGSAFVRFADSSEEREIIATVKQSDGRLAIWHHRVYLVREWEVGGNKDDRRRAVTECVSVLESLARAQHLVDMQNDAPREPLELALSHEIGYVQDGRRTPYEGPGVTLVEDTRMYISVTNTGSHTLYVSMFDICGDSVTLLSKGSPSGIELLAGETSCFGEVDVTGELRGSRIRWPPDIPKAETMPEDISLVITDGKIDLRNLATGPGSTRREEKRASGLGTWLAHLADSINFGGLRTVQSEGEGYKHMRYRVVGIPCQLCSRDGH